MYPFRKGMQPASSSFLHIDSCIMLTVVTCATGLAGGWQGIDCKKLKRKPLGYVWDPVL